MAAIICRSHAASVAKAELRWIPRLCTPATANPIRNDVTMDLAKSVAGGDHTEVAVRRLRKKLKQMDLLEQRQKEGCVLCDDQLQKVARLPEVRRQLAELTAPIPDAWD